MRKPTQKELLNAKRQFIQLSKAWYAKVNIEARQGHDRTYVDDIHFGLYSEDGGCYVEMVMVWYRLSANTPPSAKLEIFHDAFAAMPVLAPLFMKLADLGEYPSREEFKALLTEFGFEDATPLKRS